MSGIKFGPGVVGAAPSLNRLLAIVSCGVFAAVLGACTQGVHDPSDDGVGTDESVLDGDEGSATGTGAYGRNSSLSGNTTLLRGKLGGIHPDPWSEGPHPDPWTPPDTTPEGSTGSGTGTGGSGNGSTSSSSGSSGTGTNGK